MLPSGSLRNTIVSTEASTYSAAKMMTTPAGPATPRKRLTIAGPTKAAPPAPRLSRAIAPALFSGARLGTSAEMGTNPASAMP